MSAIYLVEIDDEKRLVKANSKSVAVNHVVKSNVKARPVTASEVVDLIGGGMSVEEAGKPSTAKKQEEPEEILGGSVDFEGEEETGEILETVAEHARA